MALEVPVIATIVGGSTELVRDGRDGYLVSPHEPAAWANAVSRMIECGERRDAMGRAARERVLESFTVWQQAESTLSVYRRALEARRGVA
jgi:glycosyltransferase involved in cell wall biosynthesis